MAADPIAVLNFQFAAALVRGLAAHGVEQAVISPGSRSTPLALASDAVSEIRTWVQPDERSAAFFALGLAKGSGRPVALISTSGSAPTHWYPAVVEADMAGVPLILLSADRPPELQDCQANQTIDQIRLFGPFVRAFHSFGLPDPETIKAIPGIAARLVDQASWPLAGPVHVNLPFREPLVPDPVPPLAPCPKGPVVVHPAPVENTAGAELLADLFSSSPGVIVCGRTGLDQAGVDAVAGLAAALRVPVLADPLSGMRFGEHDLSHVISFHDAFLRSSHLAGRLRPQWLLSIGGPPVSKILNGWLENCGAETRVAVDPSGRWPDPSRDLTHIMRADPAAVARALTEVDPAPAPSGWLEGFIAAEAVAASICGLPLEGEIARTFIDVLPQASTLFSGNSLSIRQIDWFSAKKAKDIRVMANRGASGIDGNISTLLGLAATGRGWLGAMIGDLAFFHDMNGLLLARESGLNAVIAVIDNGGGGIFGHLPQADLAGFERLWLTPTGIDIGRAAELFGLPCSRVADVAGFRSALSEALEKGGVHILHVPVDRKESMDRHRSWRDRTIKALGG